MYFVWVPFESDPRGSTPQTGVPKVLDPYADASLLRSSLGALDHDQLVSAWRSSDRCLGAEVDVDRRLALVRLRALMLDEVEIRSPRRLRRWLRAGGPCRWPGRRH